MKAETHFKKLRKGVNDALDTYEMCLIISGGDENFRRYLRKQCNKLHKGDLEKCRQMLLREINQQEENYFTQDDFL